MGAREARARASLEATADMKARHPFNCMHATYAEHAKEETKRIKNSKHRFFEYPEPQMDPERAERLFTEGLRGTARQSAIIGYGDSGNRRLRAQSVGAGDNFAHIRGCPPEPA